MTAARACASRGGFFTQSRARVLPQVTRQGRESVNNMNETPANAPRSSDSSGPLDSITHGRLRFLSGASNVTVHADPSGGGLYRSRFEGVVPEVWTEGGVVNIWYPRFYSFGRRGCSGKVALNATIPWRIEVRGGASKVTADLSQLKLGSFGVAGGASKVELTLPRASGLVPVRVLGGASNVVIHRPEGVATRVRVVGGSTNLTFDDQRFGAVGSEVNLQNPNYDCAPGRCEITITGGASNVAIDSR